MNLYSMRVMTQQGNREVWDLEANSRAEAAQLARDLGVSVIGRPEPASVVLSETIEDNGDGLSLSYYERFETIGL